MKAPALLLFAFAVFAFTDDVTALTDSFLVECGKSYGLTKESIFKLSESEKSCAFQICYMRDLGLINKDNSFNANDLIERRKSHVPESKIHEAVKTCDAETLDTFEKSCKAVNCLMGLLPESDFNSEPNATN